jgi:hypothetical protein
MASNRIPLRSHFHKNLGNITHVNGSTYNQWNIDMRHQPFRIDVLYLPK